MSTKKLKQEKRPSSDNFVDLHIFVVPYELWMEKYRTAYNSSTLESISAGFVRVPSLMTLEDLRNQITEQLSGGDILPYEYVFLRCVGRCLAIVNKVQESSLKVKHFLPPVVSSPEIFVLFGNHESLSHNASDLQDYGHNLRGYLACTREEDERCSSEEKDKTVNFDTDLIQRHVRFKQNESSAKDGDHDSKRNADENTVRTVEETHLTEIPQATKTSEEQQHAKRLSNSSQENQKSQNKGHRLLSESDQNLHDSQHCSDIVNNVSSHVRPSSDKRSDKQDTKLMTSSFDEQHPKSPRKKIPKKNPLLHSKTAPSLLQTLQKETNVVKSKENEQNERKNKKIKGNDEHGERLHNEEGSEHDISSKYPDDVEHARENEREMTNKVQGSPEDQGMGYFDIKYPEVERLGTERNGTKHHDRGYDGKERDTDHHAYGTEHDDKGYRDTKHTTERHDAGDGAGQPGIRDDNNECNFQVDKQLTSKNDEGYKETQVVDSTQENIKHSADHSVASSGFESLNQSNNNTHDMQRTETNFGVVTLADKENLVLQLQAELNAVRSERSNSEKIREQLLKKAKNLQNQNNQKRNQAKTVWKKKYFEEKKKTVSLEERCNQLRYEVEVIHKKILSSGDAKDRDSASAYLNRDGDPKKLNAKIMLTRKENDVEELRRRVEEAKIKLGSEMKLRDNAQKELKHIRDEVIDKKINATLVKKSLSLLETRSPNDI